MKFDTIAGLPLHPLVVHATEVMAPAAALDRARGSVAAFPPLGPVLPFGLGLAALVLVPISTQSGEALQERVKDSSLISRHADLAEGLLPWIFVLFVVSGVLLWWNRAERTGSRRALPDGSPSCWP